MSTPPAIHVASLDECASTQDEARRLLDAGHGPVVVVHAGHQTAGRGREGRTWHDEPGSSLLMSVAIDTPPAAADAASWMGAAAAGCCALLVERYGIAAALRLPNDVMVAGRKVGGLLADARSSGAGPVSSVVFGLGLNLAGERSVIDGRDATSLAAEGVTVFANPFDTRFSRARDELRDTLVALFVRIAGHA